MNEVQTFVLEGRGIRGALVRLTEAWQQLVAAHDYPDRIRRLLGESMAATVLLTTGLKGRPRVSMQLQGDGPLRLLLMQCSDELRVRGLAQWRGRAPSGPLLGSGRLAVNVYPDGSQQAFQGIVPLVSEELCACLEAYFRQSEQLPTRLFLQSSERRASGLLLQRLPGAAATAEELGRLAQEAAALPGEALDMRPARELLPSLFSGHDIRLFGARQVAHDCRCTPAHLADIVRMLGADELHSLLEGQGHVELNCEFCNHAFRYTSTGIERILAGDDEPPSRVH